MVVPGGGGGGGGGGEEGAGAQGQRVLFCVVWMLHCKFQCVTMNLYNNLQERLYPETARGCCLGTCGSRGNVDM